MDIKTKIIDVSPAMAERWLLKNIINRPLYETTIAKYALDMKRGHWALNHQGICFDEDGNLIDGQQRLSAIVLSGKTIKIFVTHGMPITFQTKDNESEESYRTQLTIDGGKSRGIGDQLTLNFGIKNANLKAAIIRVIIEICIKTSHVALSALIIKQVYDLYQSEIESISTGRKHVPRLINAAALGAMAFAAKPFKKEVLEFEEGYFSGVNLSKDSPILTYRNFMFNRDKGTFVTSGTGRKTIMSHGLNCLKYYIAQEPLKKLISTNQGIDFFTNKQKKATIEVIELMRL